MPRIIDADQLKEHLNELIDLLKKDEDPCVGFFVPIFTKLSEEIDKMAEEREHGSWLECEMLDGTILYQCSCCSQEWFVPDISLIEYCPMCGAKMS